MTPSPVSTSATRRPWTRLGSATPHTFGRRERRHARSHVVKVGGNFSTYENNFHFRRRLIFPFAFFFRNCYFSLEKLKHLTLRHPFGKQARENSGPCIPPGSSSSFCLSLSLSLSLSLFLSLVHDAGRKTFHQSCTRRSDGQAVEQRFCHFQRAPRSNYTETCYMPSCAET